jgi:hypothetical protein
MGLITKTLQIKTTNKNVTYYKQFYPDIISGDIIDINVNELPSTSKTNILVKCDLCGIEQSINYFSYLRNINNYDYYSCKKCCTNKMIKTMNTNYGVDFALQSKDILDKLKQTNIIKYGTEYASQNKNVKNKTKETNIERFGVEYYTQTEEYKTKNKDTNIERYGVEFPMQNIEIYKKTRKTCLDKYDTEFPIQLDIIKNKIKQSKINNHNDENYNNREKYKETCLDKYGVDNPMKNDIIYQKFKNIIFEKYGVNYPSQLDIFYKKMLSNGFKVLTYKETDLYYQGTYEKDFLDNYINIGIERGPSIKYMYENEEHTYYSDFYYEKLNLIIEIKSSRWLNKHYEKNLIKQEYCRKQGYNFIFIIDKNYDIFNDMIKHDTYNKDHCWQYDLRLNTYTEDLLFLNHNNINISDVNIDDFVFEIVSDDKKLLCNDIKKFIEKYEWLGKMPNRPTHRFIATYKGILSGVIVLATPNNFSNFFGESTKDIEKLISRGACASWTPKNLASKLLMFSLRWMVKNTQFRIFSAYSDTEAKEIGTIYQACNFYYIGQKFGSDKLYFDLSNPNIGWTSGRNFRKKSFYKKIAKENNIEWKKEWLDNYTIKWELIPDYIKNILINTSKSKLSDCLVRKTIKKHKYVYVLGKNKMETKKLRKEFLNNNKIYDYINR